MIRIHGKITNGLAEPYVYSDTNIVSSVRLDDDVVEMHVNATGTIELYVRHVFSNKRETLFEGKLHTQNSA
jgi:5-methylthioribose kinase